MFRAAGVGHFKDVAHPASFALWAGASLFLPIHVTAEDIERAANLDGLRQCDAHARIHHRQIGSTDLDDPRLLQCSVVVVLVRPVGVVATKQGRKTCVQLLLVVRGIDIARYLKPRFIEQIAANRARVAEEQSAVQVNLPVGGKVSHDLLKQAFYFTHIVLQVGVAFDALPLLAAQQAVEGSSQPLFGVDAGLWFGKLEALDPVGVRRNGY